MSGHDHSDYEPIPGLPEDLPQGERLIWQGAPDVRVLARRVFRLRLLAIYFIALFGIHMTLQYEPGMGISSLLLGNSWMLVLAATAMLLLAGLAMAYARTTIYTVTSKRLVMRFGVALPMVINIPLQLIQSADMRRFDDGSGDIVLTLKPEKRVSYFILWPHVNPWNFFPAKPTLRSLPSLENVAAALASAAPSAEGTTAAAESEQTTGSVHSDELLGAV